MAVFLLNHLGNFKHTRLHHAFIFSSSFSPITSFVVWTNWPNFDFVFCESLTVRWSQNKEQAVATCQMFSSKRNKTTIFVQFMNSCGLFSTFLDLGFFQLTFLFVKLRICQQTSAKQSVRTAMLKSFFIQVSTPHQIVLIQVSRKYLFLCPEIW